MALTPIEPCFAITDGGYYAIVSSIDPNDEDCFEGYLLVPGEEPIVYSCRWNRGGTCRDRQGLANIRPTNHKELAKLVDIINRCQH